LVAGDPLPDDDLALRRFDPNEKKSWSFDEASKTERLRSGAFRFDAYEDGTAGCSVYQRGALPRLELRVADCLEAPRTAMAAAAAEAIRAVKRANVPDAVSPFDVVEDPYPHGEEGVHARDGAHALILHRQDLPGNDKWYRELAKAFYRLEVV